MKKQLSRIAVLKTGVFLAALQAVLGLVVAIPISLSMAAVTALSTQNATQGHQPFGIAISGFMFFVMILLIPIFYGIVGFIGGIILAAIYNLIAKLTGGLEFEVRDLPPQL